MKRENVGKFIDNNLTINPSCTQLESLEPFTELCNGAFTKNLT